MPFSGNVETIPLDEVIQFIASNSVDGMLTVAGGGAKLTLHFFDGMAFFPFSAKRGTYSLGKILRQTGVLSREALEKHMEHARQNRIQELRALEAQASTTQLEDAKRKQYEEEIHDVFLWRRAYFEFFPGSAAEEIQRDRQLGKGATFEPTALLMEVARRADERRRIRRSIPSGRAILVAKKGHEAPIDKALAARQIDVVGNPFEGRASLEELLEKWGIPHHQALGTVAPLVEGGHVEPLALDVARSAFEQSLALGDARAASRFLVHVIELGAPPREPLDLGLEKDLLTAPTWRSADEIPFTTRFSGPRAFALLRLLVSPPQATFTFTAREDGREKRLSLSPEHLTLTATTDEFTPPVAKYLRRMNLVSEVDLKAATFVADQDRVPPTDILVRSGKLKEEDVRRAALEKVVDELAELLLWRDVEIEIRNRARPFTGKGESGALGLSIALSPQLQERLAEGIEKWFEAGKAVPGEDSLYFEGEKTKDGDPAGKFFSRFDGRRTVGELRRLAKADALEFVRFVHAGLKRGYARRPTREEIAHRLDTALKQQDDVRAYRLARAGVVFGLGEPFSTHLDKLKALDALPSPDSRPSLEGDMRGLSLAAVLQGLRTRGRTGTLVLTDGKRESKLYFHRGSVFLLRVEDAAAQEFVDFFLDGGTKEIEFVGGSLDQRGQVSETDLDADEARRVKDEILDVLFWEDAKFTFWKNDLPPEFFDPNMSTTKVALNTDVFLMEAIGRIQEWDSVRRVIPSGKCSMAFASLEAKLTAIRERGMSEVLTIVDGRHTFDDVVRISNQSRLEVGRLLRDLADAGDLRVLEPAVPASPTS